MSQHFIYPISDGDSSKYVLPEDWPVPAKHGHTSTWRLARGWHQAKVDDYIWVYNSCTLKVLEAVGRVSKPPYEDSSEYQIEITWDGKLSTELLKNPIHLRDLSQETRKNLISPIALVRGETLEHLEQWKNSI